MGHSGHGKRKWYGVIGALSTQIPLTFLPMYECLLPIAGAMGFPVVPNQKLIRTVELRIPPTTARLFTAAPVIPSFDGINSASAAESRQEKILYWVDIGHYRPIQPWFHVYDRNEFPKKEFFLRAAIIKLCWRISNTISSKVNGARGAQSPIHPILPCHRALNTYRIWRNHLAILPLFQLHFIGSPKEYDRISEPLPGISD